MRTFEELSSYLELCRKRDIAEGRYRSLADSRFSHYSEIAQAKAEADRLSDMVRNFPISK